MRNPAIVEFYLIITNPPPLNRYVLTKLAACVHHNML